MRKFANFLLIAVLILAIFVSMAAVGTTALFGTAESVSEVSKAAVLGSDVMQVLTNEIRYGENFAPQNTGSDKTKLVFDSSSYGTGCTLFTEAGELRISKASSAGEGAEDSTFMPLGSAAYDEVKIKTLTFDVASASTDAGTKSIGIVLEITGSGGGTLWKNEVSIVPLCSKYQG